MVDAARANVERSGPGTVEFKTADGTNLPFEDDSFDVVSCQFGVMFYADKRVGYREAARVLKPGGSFVLNVWDAFAENPFCRIVHETVVALHPDNPPGFLAVPFGYYDLNTIKSDLQTSGFGEVGLTVLPGTSRASSARDLALALVAGTPLASQLAERGDRGSGIRRGRESPRRPVRQRRGGCPDAVDCDRRPAGSESLGGLVLTLSG